MGTQTPNSQVAAHIQLHKLGHTSWVDFSVLAYLLYWFSPLLSI